MKKLFIIAAVAVASAACMREVQEQLPASFRATIVPVSKVTLSEGVKCSWEQEDAISVFGSDGANYRFSTAGSGSTAVFDPDGQTHESGLASSSPYAVYPYAEGNSISGTVISTGINPVQTAVKGNFPANQKPVLLARADGSGKLSFKHAAAIVKITIASSEVTSIVLKSSGNEHLCGTVSFDFDTLDCTADGGDTMQLTSEDGSPLEPGTYYLAAAPATLSKGFTVSLLPEMGGVQNYKRTTKQARLLPGHILDLGTVDYTDKAAPSVTLDSTGPAYAGEEFVLTLTFSDPSGIAPGWCQVSSWETLSGRWAKPFPGRLETQWWENNGGLTFPEDAGTSYTMSWTVIFPEAGKYAFWIGPLSDNAGNSYSGNMGFTLTVEDPGESVSRQTFTGLADGYYDISFTASRALSGGIVYVSASSGSNPVRKTPLRYGTDILHMIRGVKVSGGKCTVETHALGHSPAEFSLSDFSFSPGAEWNWLQGGEMSRLNMELDYGVTYKENGKVKDPVQIAVDNGWNFVRLRIYNDPGNPDYYPSNCMTAGYTCVEDMLKLARKASAAGLQILLTLHYSDYWSDPGQQIVPHEWNGYTESQLKQAVYDYTVDVLSRMVAQGTPPQFVAVGNELNKGMFFGRDTHHYYFDNLPKLVSFFNEGARAVRETVPSAKVIFHLTNIQAKDVIDYKLSKVKALKIDYDILGLTYYPFWTHLTNEQFVALAEQYSSTSGKKVIVMESGINWNPVTYYNDEGQLKNQGPYDDIYPPTEEGQRNYIEEELVELKKSSCVVGMIYWDPYTVRLLNFDGMDHLEDGVMVPNHDNGTITQNAAMFDFSGNMLDVWNAFKYNN